MSGSHQAINEFTRFLCPRCGQDGVHSWNKSAWDGPGWDQPPNPMIFGEDCNCCGWPLTVRYDGPEEPPVAILCPDDPPSYTYEDDAMAALEQDRAAGVVLSAATTRDADWSRGCLAARAQLQ